LSFQRIDDIECCHCLSPGVLSVSHRVSHHVFQEDLEDVATFVVDESANALDPASARQSANSGLGDALDVLADDSPVPLLGSDFAQSFASFASADHAVFKRGREGLLSWYKYPCGLCSATLLAGCAVRSSLSVANGVRDMVDTGYLWEYLS